MGRTPKRTVGQSGRSGSLGREQPLEDVVVEIPVFDYDDIRELNMGPWSSCLVTVIEATTV